MVNEKKKKKKKEIVDGLLAVLGFIIFCAAICGLELFAKKWKKDHSGITASRIIEVYECPLCHGTNFVERTGNNHFR